MTDFNSYMGNIDTDFFRELCLRNGELRYYKRNEFILREGEVGSFFGFIVSHYHIPRYSVGVTPSTRLNILLKYAAPFIPTIVAISSVVLSVKRNSRFASVILTDTR